MLPIAGQTTGPIGLKFVFGHSGGRRVYRLKNFNLKKIHWQRRALQLVYNITIITLIVIVAIFDEVSALTSTE